MKTYFLEIRYNPDTDEVEFVKEEIVDERPDISIGDVDVGEYFDEEALKLIDSLYILGES